MESTRTGPLGDEVTTTADGLQHRFIETNGIRVGDIVGLLNALGEVAGSPPMTTGSVPVPGARLARTPRRHSGARRQTGDRSAPAPARWLGRGSSAEYRLVGCTSSTRRVGMGGWLAGSSRTQSS